MTTETQHLRQLVKAQAKRNQELECAVLKVINDCTLYEKLTPDEATKLQMKSIRLPLDRVMINQSIKN